MERPLKDKTMIMRRKIDRLKETIEFSEHNSDMKKEYKG